MSKALSSMREMQEEFGTVSLIEADQKRIETDQIAGVAVSAGSLWGEDAKACEENRMRVAYFNAMANGKTDLANVIKLEMNRREYVISGQSANHDAITFARSRTYGKHG